MCHGQKCEIASKLANRDIPHKILVTNSDGSTGRTLPLLHAWHRNRPHCVCLTRQDQMASAARGGLANVAFFGRQDYLLRNQFRRHLTSSSLLARAGCRGAGKAQGSSDQNRIGTTSSLLMAPSGRWRAPPFVFRLPGYRMTCNGPLPESLLAFSQDESVTATRNTSCPFRLDSASENDSKLRRPLSRGRPCLRDDVGLHRRSQAFGILDVLDTALYASVAPPE